jgi:hypothetical protein
LSSRPERSEASAVEGPAVSANSTCAADIPIFNVFPGQQTRVSEDVLEKMSSYVRITRVHPCRKLANLGILPFNSGNQPPNAGCFQSLNMTPFWLKIIASSPLLWYFLRGRKIFIYRLLRSDLPSAF